MMYMAKHHDNLQHDVEKVLEAYKPAMRDPMLDCRALAQAGRFLLHAGGPEGGRDHSISGGRRARRILSIMMLCGQYDGSGDFAYRVGLPAKSGVGGGILAVAPHRASIAVWSPALDPMGNSLLGTLGLGTAGRQDRLVGVCSEGVRWIAEAFRKLYQGDTTIP